MNLQWPDVGRSGFAWLDDAIQSVLAKINAIWNVQHNGDGTHSAVTCDTLSLGAVSVSNNGNVTGSLVPTTSTQDLGATITLPGSSVADHPWRHLRLSGTISWAAFSTGAVASLPSLTRSGSALTWNFPAGVGSLLTLAFPSGTITFSDTGTISAVTGSFSGSIAAASAVISGTVAATGGYFEHSRSAALGEWTDVTFSTANFTASAGLWQMASVNQALFRWMLFGKTMVIAYQFNGTTVTAAPAQLRFAIPGGFTAAKDSFMTALYNDNGAGWVSNGNAFTAAGLTYVAVQPGALGAGAWSISAANTAIRGLFILEIQ